MHTALIAIAGSALTLGIFTATNQPTPMPAQHGAAISALAVSEADTPENAVPTADYAFAKGGTIDLRTATLTTIFEKVRANLDRPLVIHWEHLEQIGIPKDQPIGLDADPVPTEVALRLAIQRAETEDFGGIAVVDHPDAVEITTTEYLDHRTTQIKPHDIADLIAYYEVPDQRFTSPTTPAQEVRTRQTAEHAGREIFETVQTLASSDDWVDFGGDLARGRVVGGSLIIDAPARIHAEVESVIAMMIEQVQRYEAEARAAQAELDARAEELEAMKRREREIAIAKLTNDLEESLDRILVLESRQAELEQEGRMLQIRANKFNRFEGENEEEAAERQKKAAAEQAEREPALRAELSRITIELADTHAYRDAARNQLIEIRYEPFTTAERENDRANLADRVRRTREAQRPTSGN